jgi:hypothetical protein
VTASAQPHLRSLTTLLHPACPTHLIVHSMHGQQTGQVVLIGNAVAMPACEMERNAGEGGGGSMRKEGGADEQGCRVGGVLRVERH